jgi:phosphate transport system permease protein
MKVSSRTTQRIAWGVMWVAAAIVIVALLLVIGYVLVHGIPALNLQFIFGSTTEGGLRAPIVGTLYMVVLTLIVVVPLGVGAAIYLSEYAPRNRFSDFIRYCLDGLAGVPSIIFGLFGVALFVVVMFKTTCILAGALTMAALSLPFMVGAAEEAIRAVPQYQREAALALGATKWQTIWHVVLPSALPGIITGIILCTGTAVAETAPLLATSGYSAFVPVSPLDGCRTLALHLFYIATEAPCIGGLTRQDLIAQAMGVGAILITIVIVLNFLMRWLSRRYVAKITGGS